MKPTSPLQIWSLTIGPPRHQRALNQQSRYVTIYYTDMLSDRLHHSMAIIVEIVINNSENHRLSADRIRRVVYDLQHCKRTEIVLREKLRHETLRSRG